MAKLSNEFKNEVNTGFKQGSYIGRRLLMYGIILVVILAAVGAGMRFMGVNVDRMIFKNSITYTEGTTQFLAKSYREYNQATDMEEKKAIREYVIMRYPNLDYSHIENQQLRSFYESCVLGK